MSISQIAEVVADLNADQLWELALELNKNYAVPANLLKADLEFVEWDRA